MTEENEKIEARLVAAKTKVTGMRQHEYIGRLKLVAAIMGVNLALKIAKAFQLDLEKVTYFTDSMAVLYWLSTPAALSGHRLAKIMERNNFQQWILCQYQR